jgi:hypothetical protein
MKHESFLDFIFPSSVSLSKWSEIRALYFNATQTNIPSVFAYKVDEKGNMLEIRLTTTLRPDNELILIGIVIGFLREYPIVLRYNEFNELI